MWAMNGDNRMISRKIRGKEDGFTLIELLITLIITGAMSTAMFSFYRQTLRTDIAQSQLVMAQQNLRASLGLMTRELRMAGFDPTRADIIGISAATSSGITIVMDIDGVGDGDTSDPDEQITFGFAAADDPDADGLAGNNAQEALGFAANLGRNVWNGAAWGGVVAIAEDIQAIEFYYTLEDGTQTLTPAILADIRTVEMSVLARAANVDPDYSDTVTYTTGSGVAWGPYNDNYRRKFLKVKTILRNMSRSLRL